MMKRKSTKNDGFVVPSYNAKNGKVSDEHLTEIFANVGAGYGYTNVRAEFIGVKDFKVKWTRTYDWIRFEISDYLDRAPDKVLNDLALKLFETITGGVDVGYGEDFIRHVNDPVIYRDNQQDFVRRSKNLSGETVGDFHDLIDCVERLRGQNLIPDDLECMLAWDSEDSNKAAGSSVLQRTVWVNKALDQKGVPEHVLDFCVYYMMCHIIAGFHDEKKSETNKKVKKLQMAHPMYEQSMDWLDNEGYYL